MTDARQRGWGNPDSALFRVRSITIGFTHSKRAFPGGVNRKIRKLAHALLHDLEQAGFVLPPTGNWGYANRDIRGLPGVKSNHSWGLALDIDAPHNPMRNGPIHTNLPRTSGKIAAKYGFIWGGDYTGLRKDPMHFEFVGTPEDARRHTRALRMTKPTPPLPRPSTNKPKGSADVNWVTLKQGDHGHAVKNVQSLLVVNGYPNLVVDGSYGPGMAAKVKLFQIGHGITATGNIGPRTMKALLKPNID